MNYLPFSEVNCSSLLLRFFIIPAFCMVVVLSFPFGGVCAELAAEQVTADRAPLLLVGGSNAVGGVGDWALRNDTLCAVISDPSRESILSARGGELVDFGHCDRHDDQWTVLESLFNFDKQQVLPVSTVRAYVGETSARIVTRGEHRGIRFETAFILDAGNTRSLRIETRLTRFQEGERLFLFGDIVFHGHRALTPFTALLGAPKRSPGFYHPGLNVDDKLSMARAMVPADLQVLVGGDGIEPGVAYGLYLGSAVLEGREGGRRKLRAIALNGVDFSILGVLTNPLWLDRSHTFGWLDLAQALLMDLKIGETLVIERSVILGDRADVNSVLDEFYADGPRVHGRVDDPSAHLHISDRDSAPIGEVRPGADGSFEFRLPKEVDGFDVEIRAPGRPNVYRSIYNREPTTQVAHAAEKQTMDIDLGVLEVEPVGQLQLPRGNAMRLVFVGINGTANPRFGEDLLDLRMGTERPPTSRLTNAISLGGVLTDPGVVGLAPGSYRVLATRGPEFEVQEAVIEVRAGEIASLEIAAPRRAYETKDWIGADLHVHSEYSFDSALPIAERIRSFVAQGGEVIVGTEHDRLVDYNPTISALGLEGQLYAIAGAEITGTAETEVAPHTIGHANAFPLPFNPLAHRGGAPPGEGRRLRDVIASVRALGGERVFQLNHPRSASQRPENMNFLDHLSQGIAFDPAKSLEASGNHTLIERDPITGFRDLDFDAIELLNGSALDAYTKVREDWFALMRQGEIKVGTANSDSHRAGEIVALPRTYIAEPEGSAGTFDEGQFIRALRAGRAFGTTGPFVRVRLGDAQIGERYRGGQGNLWVSVRAASWVPVSLVRVYVNGVMVAQRAIERNRPIEIPLTFVKDSFLTVEVSGEVSPVFAILAPGFQPFAFTNPIFIDADLDGNWKPPGLSN